MSSSFEEADDNEPETFESSDEPVYEADKIIKSRNRKGIVEYLVKWKGFNKSDSTWEKEDNPLIKPGLIDDYIERLAKKQNKSQTEKSDSKKSKDDVVLIQPKAIIDSFMKFENEKAKVFYIVLMSDNTKIQYPSKRVKKEIPVLGINFLESFRH